MLECPRCRKASPKDGAICVFDNVRGAAVIDPTTSNRCMTLIALRHAVHAWDEERIAHNSDENALMLPFRNPPHNSGALFGVLQWYKQRGNTQVAITITETGARPMSLKEAEALIMQMPSPG